MTFEDVRIRLRRKLESAFGAEEASFLMDRPVGGWSDLVTNQALGAQLDPIRSDVRDIRHELRDIRGEIGDIRGEIGDIRGEIGDLRGEIGDLRGEMADVRIEMANLRTEMARGFQAQTWRLTGATFVAFGLFATLVRLT